MADANATGTVKIGGDTTKLVISYKKAEEASGKLNIALGQTQQAWDKQAQAAKRAETATFIATARMENAKQRAADLDRVFGKAGAQSDKMAGSLNKVGQAAHHGRGPMQALGSAVHNVSVGQQSLVGAVNMVLSAFGPWGMVIGAAAGALGHYAVQQYEAAEAAKKHSEELKKQKRELADLARDEKNRKVVERLGKELTADQIRKQEEATAPIKERIRQIEKDIAQSKSGSLEVKLHEIQIMKEEAKLALQMGDLEEHNSKLHQADLAELRLTVVEEKKRTKEKEKQSKLMGDKEFSFGLAGPNFTAAGRALRNANDAAAFNGELQLARTAGMQRNDRGASAISGARESTAAELRQIELERAQDLSGQNEISRISQEEEALLSLTNVRLQYATTVGEREALLEEKRQISHDANMARLEEEKQAEEDRVATIKQTVSMGELAAKAAVAGILDIRDARRDATRAALLEGKTNREAAQAGKIAAAIALETQLKSLRNMAAMHAIEYTAKGIASQASTYGIPNPQSIGYFTAAGIFAGIAVGSGLGAMAAGNRADSLQGGASGGGFGGFGAGGAANGGRGGGAANTGPSPIDSPVPGSPTPQPRSGTLPMGNTVIYQIDKVYGTVDKDFIRKVDFGLGELGHERRRNG